jgi:LysR family transcriptional regulator for metE and metH
MEIRHLRLIQAIVEEGGITRAIDRLHLTQSALSYQLKEAEHQLGTKIFLRAGKKLILTPAGEKIYATARDILAQLEDTQKQIQKLVFGEIGEIRLSTECYSSYHWLPSVIRQFQLLYPNIDVKIVMEATHYPLQKLLSGDLDIAITSDPVDNHQFKYIELFQDEMQAIVPDTHPWAKKKFVTAHDFADQHLLIHSFPLETVTVHQFVLKPAGVTPRKITALPLTEATIEMVKADMGVLVMAKWALQPYLKNSNLVTVKIGRHGLKRKHYVATLSTSQQPEYFTQFINFLKNELNTQWSM